MPSSFGVFVPFSEAACSWRCAFRIVTYDYTHVKNKENATIFNHLHWNTGQKTWSACLAFCVCPVQMGSMSFCQVGFRFSILLPGVMECWLLDRDADCLFVISRLWKWFENFFLEKVNWWNVESVIALYWVQFCDTIDNEFLCRRIGSKLLYVKLQCILTRCSKIINHRNDFCWGAFQKYACLNVFSKFEVSWFPKR